MKSIYFLFFIFYSSYCCAQLNCKTFTEADKSTTKKCFHSNGKISTIETWDKEKREGNLKGFNKDGIELFSYGLRSFAGHSSVYLDYFKNGQVSKAEYSSAPDGGIQFYREISKYNEDGVRTSFIDLSQPDGFPSITVPEQITKEQLEKKREAEKLEEEKRKKDPNYGKPYLTVYEIHNQSKRKITIDVSLDKASKLGKQKAGTYALKPKQTLMIDSIRTAYSFLKPEEGYVISINEKQTKKSNRYKIIAAQPAQEKNRKTNSWYVIEK